ncbi:MAG: hypothetical protein ABEJ02_02490 [Candidatus Paceibacteria bacterium]
MPDRREVKNKKQLEQDRNRDRTGPVENVQSGSTVVNTDNTQPDNQQQREPERQNRQKEQRGSKSVEEIKNRETEASPSQEAKKTAEFASKASSEAKESEKSGLKLYPFPMLILSATLDVIDPFTGSLFGLLVILEIVASTSLSIMLYPQTTKEDRNFIKYILSAVVDAIPILSILPWETAVLYLIDKQKKGELAGGLENTAKSVSKGNLSQNTKNRLSQAKENL